MGSKIKRTDYERLSPADYAQWVDSMVKLNRKRVNIRDTGPKSADEMLLVAVATDLVEKNAKLCSVRFRVNFGNSKRVLIHREQDRYGALLTISRYGVAQDLSSALTVMLQELAVISSEDPKRGELYWKAARKLAVSPEPVDFVFREPVGSVRVLKTPYGDLPVSFGVTVLSTPDGAIGGLVVAASRTHVELEDRRGVIHRLRAEELHPKSGKLGSVVPLTKVVRYLTTVHFGKSSLERNGKTFYALEHLSGWRVSALAADGEKIVVKVDELTL